MKPAIGQFIPGNSILHRADPRTKILMTVVYMVAVMFIGTFAGYAVAAAFLVVAVAASGVPVKYVLRSIRPLLFIILFTIILNMFFYQGETLLFGWGIIHIYKEGILFAVKMALRILILVAGASLLTLRPPPLL